MYEVTVPETFETPDGQPFIIPEPDTRTVRKIVQAARDKGEERVNLPTVEATFLQALNWFMRGLPFVGDVKDGKPVTDPRGDEVKTPLDFDEEGSRRDIMEAIRQVEGDRLLLEKAPREVLLDRLKSDGPRAFDATCRTMYDIINTAAEITPKSLKGSE